MTGMIIVYYFVLAINYMKAERNFVVCGLIFAKLSVANHKTKMTFSKLSSS